MKKARVAPMPKRISTPPNETRKSERHNDVKPENIHFHKTVDLPIERKRKPWTLLKNTIRFKTKLRKAYEEINLRLIQDRLNSTPHDAHHAIQCLLETCNGLEGQPAQVKRKHFHRSSIRNQEASKPLIDYFIGLSTTNDTNKKLVDFAFLEELFTNGTDINAVDRHGQSVLHEIARIWHVDVAQFFLDHGSVVNHPDDYGRTPLHVACAVDYAEMVEFLILRGADLTSSTYGEDQSPIHYAAKNDASNALEVLLKYGADINDVDYKKRTPLQLAAELDRSETAEMLVEAGAPTGVYDESMMATIVLMIQKMPCVANQALNQFHATNRGSRRQFFYLNFLNPPTEAKTCFAKSPLEVVVEYKQFQLILHPAFLRLIEVKWQRLGKWGVYIYGTSNLFLTLIWTIRLCTIPTNVEEHYKGDGVISIVLEALAAGSLMVGLASEVKEFLKSKRKNDNYIEWRENQLERDLQYAHPRWPEERSYLERELKIVNEETSTYIRDWWNYMDWLTYFCMFATIVTHLCNHKIKTKTSDDLMRAIGSATLIFLWIRMLKYARPYKTLGPFVAILSHVTWDTIKVVHLALHIFIPYSAAFWLVFGQSGVTGYTLKNGELFYNIFQMSVVGDYGFEELDKHNPIMSKLLCFTYIFLGSIIILNLFIALLSDTFQRVYDNAKANAIMQRAATIVDLEADIPVSILKRHRQWIANNCAPESLYYDDDMTDADSSELKRMTHQIKQKLDHVNEYLYDHFGHPHGTTGTSVGGGKVIGKDYHPHNKHSLGINHVADDDREEVRELMKVIQSWRAEYRRSMIQTRAEIAGLGLMFKDLLEQNNNERDRKEARRKKRWLAELNESIQTKQNQSLFSLNDVDPRLESTPMPHASNNTDKTTPNNSLGTADENKINHIEDAAKNIERVETSIPSDTVGLPKENQTSTVNDGYFEGYTFNNEQDNSSDRLIKSTWNSIFSKILKEDKEEEPEQKQDKEFVYVDHFNLSTIESSGDDAEA